MIRVLCVVVIIAAGAACAGRRPALRSDFGVKTCPETAAHALLSVDALQCWFTASHGRWRTLSHESHYAVLVVEVQAADVRDANAIAQRFATGEGGTFSEILVYVQRESQNAAGLVRRIRWTRDGGFATLDFTTGGSAVPSSRSHEITKLN